MTMLWEKYVALSVETSFFQSLFFSNIKKRNMKAIRFFHFRMPFFFLFFCFAFGYFVTFSWVHTFAFLVYGVIRYVLGGPSSLSVFFFRFLLLTLLYQFSSYLSILYFDFLFICVFYSVSFHMIIFIFRLLYLKVPAGLVLKRIPQGLIQ